MNNDNNNTHQTTLQNLFRCPTVQIRRFVREEPWIRDLLREHLQRQEILKAWKEMGMKPDDIGLLADVDESFTRDFFRALQTCQVDRLDWRKNKCRHDKMGVRSSTAIFETSPECPKSDQFMWRPDLLPGGCIDGIADPNLHPPPPFKEGSIDRAVGWGSYWHPDNVWGEAHKREEENPDFGYPAYHGWEVRTLGGSQIIKRDQEGYLHSSGYHFHNFFSSPNALRFK